MLKQIFNSRVFEFVSRFGLYSIFRDKSVASLLINYDKSLDSGIKVESLQLSIQKCLINHFLIHLFEWHEDFHRTTLSLLRFNNIEIVFKLLFDASMKT